MSCALSLLTWKSMLLKLLQISVLLLLLLQLLCHFKLHKETLRNRIIYMAKHDRRNNRTRTMRVTCKWKRWEHTFSNMSGSPRGKVGCCKGDPTFGTTSPTEFDRPSFPILILRLFKSILSLRLSTSLEDGEVKFCCASISCCWCCGVNIWSWWNGWEPCINDFCCWISPDRSWSRP